MKKGLLIILVLLASASAQTTMLNTADAGVSFSGLPPNYAARSDTIGTFMATGMPAAISGQNNGIGTCVIDPDFRVPVCRVTGDQTNSGHQSHTTPSSAEAFTLSQGENPFLAVQSSGIEFFQLFSTHISSSVAPSNNPSTDPIVRMDSTHYPGTGASGGIVQDSKGNSLCFDGCMEWAKTPANAPDPVSNTAYFWAATKSFPVQLVWEQITSTNVIPWTSGNFTPQPIPSGGGLNPDPGGNCKMVAGSCFYTPAFLSSENRWMSANNGGMDGHDRMLADLIGLQQDHNHLLFVGDRMTGAVRTLDSLSGAVGGNCGAGTQWSCSPLTVVGAQYNNWPDVAPAAPTLTATGGGTLTSGHTYTVQTTLASQNLGESTASPASTITVTSPNLTIQVTTPGPTMVPGTRLILPTNSVSRNSSGIVTLSFNASTLSGYAGVNMYIWVSGTTGCNSSADGWYVLRTATSSSATYTQITNGTVNHTVDTNCNSNPNAYVYIARNFPADHYNVYVCDSTGGPCNPTLQNESTLTAPSISTSSHCGGSACGTGATYSFQIFSIDANGSSVGSNILNVTSALTSPNFSITNYLSVDFSLVPAASSFLCVIDGAGVLPSNAITLGTNGGTTNTCTLQTSTLSQYATATNTITQNAQVASLVTGTVTSPTSSSLGATLHNIKIDLDGCILRWDSSPMANGNGYQLAFWDLCTSTMVFATNLDNGTPIGMATIGSGHGVQGHSAHINNYGLANSFQNAFHNIGDSISAFTLVFPYDSSPAGSTINWDQQEAWQTAINNGTNTWPWCWNSYKNVVANAFDLPSGVWQGELDCGALDGSRKVYRFAHAWSAGGQGQFFSEPRVQMSPNGKWAVFNSDAQVNNAHAGVGCTNGASSGCTAANTRDDVYAVPLAF